MMPPRFDPLCNSATEDDQRRRYYRLTGLAQRVCAAEAERLAGLVRITRSNLRPRMA